MSGVSPQEFCEAMLGCIFLGNLLWLVVFASVLFE